MCTLIALYCGCVIFNIALEAELTEHSVKVRLFLFPFAIGECNLIYFERVEVFPYTFVAYLVALVGQTESLCLRM